MTNFEKVKAFHRAFGHPVLDRPEIPADRVELRLSLIAEEFVELREAVEKGDIVAVADALGDLAYVTYGAAAEFGIDLDACLGVIHDANMAKLGPDGKPIINDGVMRPDLPVGKVLKPKDWQAPDLREVLFGSSRSQPVLSPKSDTEAPLSGGWQDIETAPKDGTTIQARIPGHGEDNLIVWVADALDDGNGSCGAWAFALEDQEPPDCWSDGWCWAVNEEGVRSAWPTHWKPAPGEWTETDDAPEWSDDVFERAQLSSNGEIIRPSKGTLTKGEGV